MLRHPSRNLKSVMSSNLIAFLVFTEVTRLFFGRPHSLARKTIVTRSDEKLEVGTVHLNIDNIFYVPGIGVRGY